MAERSYLSLSLLGTPQICLDGKPVTGFVSSKAQALLCYLAMTGRAHTRSTLATLLWSEMPDTDARANLRVVLFNLRRLLGSHLSINRDSVAFDRSSPYWLDVETFQMKPATRDGASLEQLRAQADLYRGDFLEGFHVRNTPVFEEWALLQRERLRHLALQALHLLVAHALEQGAYADGIIYARRLLALEPWQEEAHRQLMLLLSLSGQRSAALAQYETCRRLLTEELGVAPGEETTALYDRICRSSGDEGGRRPGAPALPFVGRTAAHAALVRQYELARCGSGGLALVSGEIGIGKTRLVAEMLGYAASRGAPVLRVRCGEFGESLPYQPIADLIRAALRLAPAACGALPAAWRAALAWLVPECLDDEGAPPTPADAVAHQRLFEAIAQLIGSLTGAEGQADREHRQPAIIFVDDLQWASQATVDLLRYLLDRLRETPVWAVAAYRDDDMAPGHPALQLRYALGREGRLALLRLEPLDAEAVVQLVAELAGSEAALAEPLGRQLARESEGNPFILSEILNALLSKAQGGARASGGEPAAKRAGEAHQLDLTLAGPLVAEVPLGVREMILGRLSRLSPAAQAVMDLASVLGPRFDAALVQGAGAADAEEGLAECFDRRLLVPASGEGEIPCAFSHALVQRVVYERLSAWQRRRLRHHLAAAHEGAFLGVEVGA